MTPTVYLIHGFIGAGKTTYAKSLEQETGAIRFTVDDWMTQLYGNNPPADQFAEYEQRVKELIWKLATELIKRNQEVILDFGFWKRQARDKAKQRIEQLGASPELHAMQVPDEVMLERTLKRTKEMPEGALMIDEAGFKKMKEYFEPVAEDEKAIIISP